MEESYYYSQGRRIPVFRLESARVVRLQEDREDRDFVSIPGWRSVPLGNKRFELLLHADVISDRDVQVSRLEDLNEQLLEAERTIEEQPELITDTSALDEIEAESFPALLEKNGGLLLPTGEIVAQFRSNLDRDTIFSEVRQRSGIVGDPVTFLPNTYLLRPEVGGDVLDLANSLVADGLVEFASPNFIEEIPFRAVDPPPNTYFPQQWHLNNIGQNGARPKADVRALEAWEITTGSPDVTICIIDSGTDSKHEAFSSPGKLVSGFDFQDDDVFPDPTNSRPHGTSCAGVAAAPWGVGRVVGVAPGCSLMAIRRTTL